LSRTSGIIPLATLVAASLVGCGGGDSGTPTQGATSGESTASGGGEELAKQWGPEDMPDQVAQPLEFLYWRVDRLFEAEDLDTDGRLTADEYSGSEVNFARIDADTDGFLTKKEVIDDNITRMREEGKIP
jgi:hypothetical protein